MNHSTARLVHVEHRQAARSRSAKARPLLSFAFGLVLVIVLECLARVVLSVNADMASASYRHEWYTPSRELGWVKRPDFRGQVLGEIGRYPIAFDSQGLFVHDSEQVTDAGRPRIVTIGDSVTFGWGVPREDSFSEVLDRMLPEMSVINLGVNGYTSFQGYRALVGNMALEPSLIIAGFNYNDRRYVLSAEDSDSPDAFAAYAKSHGRGSLASRIGLARLTRTVALRFGLLKPAGVTTETEDDVRRLPARVSLDEYHRNLSRIAELGKERSIPVIFLLTHDNPAYAKHLTAGLTRLRAEDTDAAIRELKIAVNLRNAHSALARKYLAQILEQSGLDEEARRTARIESPVNSAHGGHPVHLDAEYHAVMREVASEYGVRIVDTSEFLHDDISTYLDMCHPDVDGHRKIAQVLCEAVQEAVVAAAD